MKYLDDVDEKIFNILIKLKFDGFVRLLVYTWRVKWVRNLIARLLKIYRIRQEVIKLNRSVKLNSQTQSEGVTNVDRYNQLNYLKDKHNYFLKFWFMDKI